MRFEPVNIYSVKIMVQLRVVQYSFVELVDRDVNCWCAADGIEDRHCDTPGVRVVVTDLLMSHRTRFPLLLCSPRLRGSNNGSSALERTYRRQSRALRALGVRIDWLIQRMLVVRLIRRQWYVIHSV